MKHEKTFEAIAKLKDIEIELHRLKNALEMANKALDAQRIGTSDSDKGEYAIHQVRIFQERLAQAIEKMPFGDTAASFAAFVREFK